MISFWRLHILSGHVHVHISTTTSALFLTRDSVQLKMRLFVISALLLVFGFPSIITEVVHSFSKCSEFFLEGKPPVIPGILEKSASLNNNRYKLICQRYKNVYRFATLYDTTNRIPIFSAYKYTGVTSKGRPHILWMIEPQVILPMLICYCYVSEKLLCLKMYSIKCMFFFSFCIL